ncbi:hypothetical protein JCM13304A_00540 [Desulfothermus okinawensis JCM 13304]
MATGKKELKNNKIYRSLFFSNSKVLSANIRDKKATNTSREIKLGKYTKNRKPTTRPSKIFLKKSGANLG